MILSRTVKFMARRNLDTAELGELVRTTPKAARLRQADLAGAAGGGRRLRVDSEPGHPPPPY